MDCAAHAEYKASGRMPMCEEKNQAMLPFYQLMVPNESSPQKFDYLQQPYDNPAKEDLKKWVTKNFADNSIKLDSLADLEEFTQLKDCGRGYKQWLRRESSCN